MGHRKTREGHSSGVDRVYRALQNEILSIPGHAEYFRDEIERERATLTPGAYRGNYDFNRRLAFETLPHLPSPETIKVLGDYLYDERDAVKEAMWTSDGILWGVDPNCKCALDALGSIGLRDPGFVEPDAGERPSSVDFATREKKRRAVYDYLVTRRERQLKPWRAWYAELKDGKRAFSFKGQPVEYRFKPDGTWDTIPVANSPDAASDIPPAARAVQRPDKSPLPVVPGEEQATSKRRLWSWAGGIGVVLVALLA